MKVRPSSSLLAIKKQGQLMGLETINLLLLVEDDENDIILTERQIQRSKLPVMEILIARTLSQAKNAFRSNRKIDVCLLDLNLDETKGLDTLRVVRSLYDGVIIVLTSMDNEAIGIEAIRLGAEDYLVKNKLTEERLRGAINYGIVRNDMKKTTVRFQENLEKLATLTQKDQIKVK
jgi:response regulator of citrate/malate metabolism